VVVRYKLGGRMDKDILIIGGGPGGYTAAIRAAQLGAKVVVIEEDKLGGVCLNKGCIPTKSFYKNAQMINELNRSEEFGIELNGFAININKMLQRKQQIIDRLNSGIGQLLKANSIEVIFGKASLITKEIVEITTNSGDIQRIRAKNIIIATGSIPVKPPIPGIDLPGVMTSDDILDNDRIPQTLIVIGGGVIGIEFAGIFNAMGSKVTILEFLPRILANLDGEISKKMALSLKKKGINIENEARVTEIIKTENGFEVLIEGKKGQILIPVEAVLVSTGRAPNLEGLNLDSLGIEYDRKGIKVNESYQTSIPHIYAIGDVIGGQMLAHVASGEGIAAVENIMGLKGHMDYNAIPGCVFTFPEVATVGLSEEEAKSMDMNYNSSKFMFGANGKALTMGEDEGFVKVLADAGTGKIIGAHIMGPHASDLIHEAVLAIGNKMTIDEITKCVHAHPTLSETFLEAVLGIENKAIHMAPQRLKQ
jgi:dihydrolipoamide dehydrogenase